MHCHICHREASERCYNCGELFCADHGNVNCVRCETGIVVGDSRADRVSAFPLGKSGQRAWWRPQPAEDFEPPACRECRKLAPYTCSNCADRYCREHAGRSGRCARCERALRGGNLFVVLLFLVLGALTALAFWQGLWR